MRSKVAIPIIVATVVASALAAFFINDYFYSAAPGRMADTEAGMMADDANGSMMGDDSGGNSAMMEHTSYSGQVIAGSDTPYIRYNRADFDRALSEGKSAYVYVYATWCPTCAVERPKVLQAFAGMGDSSVVGFEAHWNDGQNTAEDDALEREYGVSSQHTSLFIGSDGKLVEKNLNSIDVDAFKARLMAFGA